MSNAAQPRPSDPVEFKTEPWRKRPAVGFETGPKIRSINPNADRVAGGSSVVVSGVRFRADARVYFGGVQGTVTAVAVDGTTITVTVPIGVEVGYVDILVTNPDPLQSDTLTGGFLYYAGTMISTSPAYSITSGGTNVIIKGANLVAGSTFKFDGVAATNVVFIDDTQYQVTVPAHVSGYVDILMTEPGGGASTLRHGFQYTTLVRGSDIRRFPGTRISKSLGSTPDRAQFSLDGETHKPVEGEEIHITDSLDGNRELHGGLIMTSKQKYEGQINQLVWECNAGDFQYYLNKYRPFGTYFQVPADLIVRDLMTKYHGTTFDLAFVQTKLAKVSISFDGTKTFSEVFDTLGRAIGGGNWHLLGRALHFFNPPLDTAIIVPTGSTGPAANFTAPTLALGSSIASIVTYTAAYYAVRISFLYSNGTESRLGPTSNIVGSDGTVYLSVTNIPLGADPGGGITCTGRIIYYLQGSNSIAMAVEIDDNTTVACAFAPSAQFQPSAGINKIGTPVTQSPSGSTGTTPQASNVTTSQGGGGFGIVRFYSGAGLYFEAGGRNLFNQLIASGSSLGTGFVIPISANTSATSAYALWVQFAVSATYPDNSETTPTDFTGEGHAPYPDFAFLANITAYSPGQSPQYTCYQGLMPTYPTVNNQKPVAFNIYMKVCGYRGTSANGGADDHFYPSEQRYVQKLGSVPYFDGAAADGTPKLGSTSLSTAVQVPATGSDLGSQPQQVPNSVDQTYVWPNPDGPYLEDYSTPHTIDDNDTDLLHADSGSQPFESENDITQLRNRVKVYGAGTITVTDAAIAANVIEVANVDVFPLAGATVLASNGVEITFFGASPKNDATGANAKLLLTTPLAVAIPAGTVVQFFAKAEDKNSQAKRGVIELDALGKPTDGVHEYVVNDPSLTSMQAVYLRANAELAVYKDPITTIRYATRDPLTRVGARVTVDLTDPPCKGVFLIQSVEIDQIRDEGDQLAPRYTVVAASILYDLTNFLLMVSGGSQILGGGSNTLSSLQGGLAPQTNITNAVKTTVQGSSTISLSDFPRNLVMNFAFAAFAATNGSFVALVGSGGPSFAGGVASGTRTVDTRGTWARCTSTATVGQNAGVGWSSSFMRCDHGITQEFYIRLGSNISNMRMFFGWANTAWSNADTQTAKGWGLRFSTVFPDSGWIPFISDGTVQEVDAQGSILSPSPNGEYLITMAYNFQTNTLTYTIKDVTNGVSASRTFVPSTINQGRLTNVDGNSQWLIFTTEAVSKTIDFLHTAYKTGLN